MSKKFYRAENAGRSIAGIGFDVYDVIAGTAVGVYATEDAATQKALDEVVANPRNGVSAISEADYTLYLSKKARSFSDYKPLSVSGQTPITSGPLKGAGAVVVAAKSEEDEAELPVKIVGQVESVDDVLKTAVVEPQAEPEPVAVVEQPKPAPVEPHKPAKSGKNK